MNFITGKIHDENTSEKGYVQVGSPFDQSFSGAENQGSLSKNLYT